MPRNDGVRYGAGGVIMEIAEEPVQTEEPKKTKKRKTEILEERIHDNLPSDTEPDEEALHLGEDE